MQLACWTLGGARVLQPDIFAFTPNPDTDIQVMYRTGTEVVDRVSQLAVRTATLKPLLLGDVSVLHVPYSLMSKGPRITTRTKPVIRSIANKVLKKLIVLIEFHVKCNCSRKTIAQCRQALLSNLTLYDCLLLSVQFCEF